MKRVTVFAAAGLLFCAAGVRAQAIYINCGGDTFTASDGTQWAADEYYNGGSLFYTGSAIANTLPQDYYLFRSARSSEYGDFSYSIPVANGTYTVTLYFAEIMNSVVGQRVFNVAIGGRAVLASFDILAHTAPLTPLVEQFPVTVANGAVDIAFTGVVGRGIINAIAVTPAGTPAGVLALDRTSLMFTAAAGSANPAAQTVNVSNAGAGTLNWTAAGNQPWLTVAPALGTNAGALTIGAAAAALAPGTYTGAVTVTAAGAANSPQAIAVTLTVTPSPLLTVSAHSLAFSGTVGAGNLLAQTVNVGNGGGGALDWFASTNQPWLTISPASGTNAGTLSISAAAGNLAAGTYSGAVTVTAGAAGGSPQTIAVSLTLAAPPALSVSARSFLLDALVGGPDPAAQMVSVSNAGGGTLGWTASSDQPWLTASPAAGTNDGTVTIGVHGRGLAGGTYSGTVTVAAPGAAGSPQVIAVILKVATPPALTLGNAGTLYFNGAAGGANPPPQAVTVSNGGGGVLNWTASTQQGWLTVTPAAGTNSGTLSIGTLIQGLAQGSYSGVVTVAAAGATGSPQSIPVTLTVAPPPVLTLSARAAGFSGTAGGANPAAQAVAVTNGGGGTLNWTAAGNQSWLAVTPGSGTAPGSFSIQPVTAGLPAGNYSGTVTVSAAGAGGSPATVAVSLALAAGGSPDPLPSSGNTWFVSTAGSPAGDGSIGNPWDIVTALAGPKAVQPGDTIWVRGGRYGGGQYNSVLYSSLVGTAARPIIVRAYPGERATIDAWLQVGCCDQAIDPAKGAYTWFWGLEFASFNPNRSAAPGGPPDFALQDNHNSADSWAPGTKFIDNIVHDTAGGFSVWSAPDNELYGNILYNIGGYGTDRGHGHSFYLQNQAPSVLAVNDNISFNGFDIGVQVYATDAAYVQNVALDGNIVFNSGSLYGARANNVSIGGGVNGPSGIQVTNNYFYITPELNLGFNEIGYLFTYQANDAVVTGNYFIGGNPAVDVERWNTLTFENNTVYANAAPEAMLIYRDDQNPAVYQYRNNRYYGSNEFLVVPACDTWPCNTGPFLPFAGWLAATGLDAGSTFTAGPPAGAWTFVRPNRYEPGRANIVVFNWSLSASAAVDLSASGIKPGDPYQIRDAENWDSGPVTSGVYTGAPVNLRMTGLTVTQPFGVAPHPATHTAPQFGVFVLLSGSALGNAY